MKYMIGLCLGFTALAGAGFAIERTAGPVVDPAADIQRQMHLPICATGTPVVVSGTEFVCGPTCPDNAPLVFKSNKLACGSFPTPSVPTPTPAPTPAPTPVAPLGDWVTGNWSGCTDVGSVAKYTGWEYRAVYCPSPSGCKGIRPIDSQTCLDISGAEGGVGAD